MVVLARTVLGRYDRIGELVQPSNKIHFYEIILFNITAIFYNTRFILHIILRYYD